MAILTKMKVLSVISVLAIACGFSTPALADYKYSIVVPECPAIQSHIKIYRVLAGISIPRRATWQSGRDTLQQVRAPG